MIRPKIPISVIDLFLIFIFCVGGVASSIGFFGNVYWAFDLFAHFREYYLLVFFVLFFIALWRKKWLFAIFSFLFFSINATSWVSFYIPPKQNNSAGSKLIIYSANVQTKNTEYHAVSDQIEDIQPDIIVLSEVNEQWVEEMKKFNNQYPYMLVPPVLKRDEILMMSKYKLNNESIIPLGNLGRLNLIASIKLDDTYITIIGSHPLPPVSKRLAGYRDSQLEDVGELIINQEQPTLLLGDLNVTPFSYQYRKLINNAGLTHCSKGFGLPRTWQHNIFIFPIPLALDHCLYTKGITVSESYVGKNIGSDHLPIITVIQVD